MANDLTPNKIKFSVKGTPLKIDPSVLPVVTNETNGVITPEDKNKINNIENKIDQKIEALNLNDNYVSKTDLNNYYTSSQIDDTFVAKLNFGVYLTSDLNNEDSVIGDAIDQKLEEYVSLSTMQQTLENDYVPKVLFNSLVNAIKQAVPSFEFNVDNGEEQQEPNNPVIEPGNENQPVEYMIEFDISDADEGFDVPEPLHILAGETANLDNAMTSSISKDGYTLLGWSTEPGQTSNGVWVINNVNQNYTLYPVFVQNESNNNESTSGDDNNGQGSTDINTEIPVSGEDNGSENTNTQTENENIDQPTDDDENGEQTSTETNTEEPTENESEEQITGDETNQNQDDVERPSTDPIVNSRDINNDSGDETSNTEEPKYSVTYASIENNPDYTNNAPVDNQQYHKDDIVTVLFDNVPSCSIEGYVFYGYRRGNTDWNDHLYSNDGINTFTINQDSVLYPIFEDRRHGLAHVIYYDPINNESISGSMLN